MYGKFKGQTILATRSELTNYSYGPVKAVASNCSQVMASSNLAKYSVYCVFCRHGYIDLEAPLYNEQQLLSQGY